MHENQSETGMLRPTLILGAGGTGYEIVARVKARFYETFTPDRLRQIRFIVFDTDTNHPPVQNSVGDWVRLTPDRELVQIGGVPVNGIIENKSSYPAYSQELELDRLPRVDLTKGARQVRQLGRLALFFHFERVRNLLLDALTNILNIGHYREAGAESIQSVNVFYVSSTCGGTGSGIMLDLAYLTRYLAKSRGIPEGNIFNIGLFLMPDAYKVPPSNRRQIRANACAMLNEIEYFTQGAPHGGPFDVTFPDTVRIRDTLPPFHMAYLVDDTNERNLTVENDKQLAAIMAEALFLQAGSYVGLSTWSVFDNMPGASGSDSFGFTRTYSMVGAATLRFNGRRMQRACARMLQRELVHEVLLHPLPAHDPRRERDENPIHPAARPVVESFLSAALIRPAQLLDSELRRVPAPQAGVGPASMVVNIATDRLARESRDRIVSRVEAACRHYAQSMVQEQFLAQMERNRHIAGQRALDLLRDHTLVELNHLESGLPRAEAFLSGVLIELETAQRQLQERLGGNRAALVRAERELTAARDNFRQAAKQFDVWGLVRTPLDSARHFYVQAFQQVQNLTLDAGVISHSQILVNELRDATQKLAAALGVMRATLDRAADAADRDLDWLRRHWTTGYITEQNVDQVGDIERFFVDYTGDGLVGAAQRFLSAPDLGGWLQQFAAAERLSTTVERPADELPRRLEQFCLAHFAPIAEHESIEKQIKARLPDETGQARLLRDLRSLAAPFSNFEFTNVGMDSSNLDPIVVLGLEDKDQSIFAGAAMGGMMPITTFDKNRLSILDTRHGLPLDALRQYGEYRQHLYRYQADRARRAGFYCYRPARDRLDARRLFVLGEAYGLIARDKEGVYSLDGQPLGDTLPEVWQAIGNDPATQEKLRVVETDWSRGRHQERLDALRDYVRRPRGQWSQSHDRDMRQLAQAELDFATDLAAL